MNKDYNEYDVEVLRVIDENIIEVNIDLGFSGYFKDKLKFLDFNVPEIYKSKLQEKTNVKQLLNKIHKHKIKLETDKRKKGKYGGILTRIIADDITLVTEMISLRGQKELFYNTK